MWIKMKFKGQVKTCWKHHIWFFFCLLKSSFVIFVVDLEQEPLFDLSFSWIKSWRQPINFLQYWHFPILYSANFPSGKPFVCNLNWKFQTQNPGEAILWHNMVIKQCTHSYLITHVFGCPRQLNKWPCQWVSEKLS